jgi:glycosyltransferase involved in cell wall biosynthesis
LVSGIGLRWCLGIYYTVMENRKLLIVTYYWPPAGGSGVQRWLKFVKYLHRAGWEPYVFTPENPYVAVHDESLLSDVPASVKVIRFPIWEPYGWFQRLARLTGGKAVAHQDFIGTDERGLLKQFSSWVRGNFFIPDARVFWVRPATRFLDDLIKSNDIRTIVTTGPPHSLHLIGLKLKRLQPSIRWIADFRDPWSDWDLLDTLSLTSWARRRHRVLERRVLVNADKVITIAPYHVMRLESLGGRKVELITNGFDREDFERSVHKRTDKFTIRHIGGIDQLRDPRPLVSALGSLVEHDPEMANTLQLDFVGSVNSNFIAYVEREPVVSKFTRFFGQRTHEEVLELYKTTDLQLLVLAHTAISPGNLPGKFFEYLASGNPILALGPPSGDAGRVLNETGAGKIFDPEEQSQIQLALRTYWQRWKEGRPSELRSVDQYTRERLTDQLIRLIESMTKE